ncbi:MAG: 3-oxoacyl-[acyl-carrier-protein] synthase III C-terminal domain-containing protein [Deltaproteobacteria bacterium]
MESAGIAGIGVHVPEGRMTTAEIARRSGIDEQVLREDLGLGEKAIGGPDDHPSTIGATAARRALEHAGVAPEDVGLVICVSISRDYVPSWSMAAKIMDEVGIRDGFGYDLAAGCAGGLTGLDIAKKWCASTPRAALIVAAERWTPSIDYERTRPAQALGHADGGAAAVVRAGGGIEIGPASFITYPHLNDYFFIPAGGTKNPPSEETLREGMHCRQCTDREQFVEVFKPVYITSYERSIRNVCESAGIERPDFLLTNQTAPKVIAAVRETIGLGPEQTFGTLDRYGHLGAADPFVVLREAVAAGRDVGEHVVMATSAIHTFGALYLRVKPGALEGWR